MKILILGGTAFLGPALVAAATARGHTVTTFNRGRTERVVGRLEHEVERLHGNRDPNLRAVDDDPESPKGLEQLKGRSWDVVFDTSGYVPRIVQASAELLGPNVGHYTFISSVSVYKTNSTPGMDETAPLATLDDPATEQVTGPTFGALKALCEAAAEDAMPGRVANIRPGLIIGPGDPTGRFTYWPVRLQDARNDRADVLAPGSADHPVQVIDVRDLAQWCVRMAEKNQTGIFNALGPPHDSPERLTMGAMLAACKSASENEARLIWVKDEFLAQHNVGAFMEMPVWIPDDEQSRGFHRRDVSRAVAAGLTFRPISSTCRDTLAWWNGLSPEMRERFAGRAGMRPQREREILDAWQKRSD